MASATFDEALRRLLVHEGGYSNHPSDPGGATNFGITIADYRKYKKPNATAADVRAMKVAEAKVIYRSKYWDKLRCDDLPAGLDFAVFDYGVNSGTGRPPKVLRRIMRLPAGTAMDATVLAAIQKREPEALIKALCDERLAFLKALRTWSVFGVGWGRRVREVRAAALQMAKNQPKEPIVAAAISAKAFAEPDDSVSEAVAVEEFSSVNSGEEVVAEPATDPAVTLPLTAVAVQKGDPELWNVQRRLEAMGYNPGGLDGKWGITTPGAIAGFISGRKLDIIAPTSMQMFRDVQEELKAEIARAEADGHKRQIVPERKFADAKTVEAAAPEIVPVKQGKFAAIFGAIGTFFAMIFNAVVEYFREAMEMVASIKDAVPTEIFFALVIGVCGFLWWKTSRGESGITDAFKTGERL